SVTRLLVSSVASDPSNLGKTLSRHAKSELHYSVEGAENFRSIMSGEQKDVVAPMSSSGHCGEDRGNFKALLEYQAKHNAILKDNLENGDSRTKYTSNKIQNEIIDICVDQIKSKIVESCNSVPFVGSIAGKTTGASTMKRMALCLRYHETNSRYVTENVIGFAKCTSISGESLSTPRWNITDRSEDNPPASIAE
ncbi:hypothetical protein MAR_033515, partial [Mya arenaria]